MRVLETTHNKPYYNSCHLMAGMLLIVFTHMIQTGVTLTERGIGKTGFGQWWITFN